MVKVKFTPKWHRERRQEVDRFFKHLRETGHHPTWLADQIGVSRQAIHGWRRIPAEQVLRIERLTGYACTALRADLYPADRVIPLVLEAA